MIQRHVQDQRHVARCGKWCHENCIPGFANKTTQEQLDWKCWSCDPGYMPDESTDDEASQQSKRMIYVPEDFCIKERKPYSRRNN